MLIYDFQPFKVQCIAAYKYEYIRFFYWIMNVVWPNGVRTTNDNGNDSCSMKVVHYWKTSMAMDSLCLHENISAF